MPCLDPIHVGVEPQQTIPVWLSDLVVRILPQRIKRIVFRKIPDNGRREQGEIMGGTIMFGMRQTRWNWRNGCSSCPDGRPLCS